MNAEKARLISKESNKSEYKKALDWITYAAKRGDFKVRLYSIEFNNLHEVHNKLVDGGFGCLLFDSFLEVSW